MKTLKTWAIMQRSGKKFKRKSDGLIVTIDKDGTIHDSIYEYLNINDEWEEVKDPVSFTELIDKDVYSFEVEHPLIKQGSRILTNYYDLMDIIGAFSNARDIRWVLKDGKFYID